MGRYIWLTCKAHTVPKFNELYRTLEAHNKVAWDILQTCGPDKWSRAHFRGDRYNIMTSNNAESINALTKVARRMPIVMLMEFYRATLQQWYFKRRNVGGTTKFCLMFRKLLLINIYSLCVLYINSRIYNTTNSMS